MPLPLVLVHGGAHGAWCWAPTLDLLDAAALAVDLPPKALRGVPAPERIPDDLLSITLDDFATSALADVDAAGIDRFVLVGHSMGGLTVAEMARRASDRVAHLVFVSCMVPKEGGLVADAVPSHSQDALRETMQENDGALPPAEGAVGLGEDQLRLMFCNDMDEAQTRFVLDHVGTEAFGVFAEHVSRVGIPPTLPKTYLRLLRDQALTPDDQDRAIAALQDSPGGDVAVLELDAGHNVMISAPHLLAPVLDGLAARAAP